jgi:hypothetical protein
VILLLSKLADAAPTLLACIRKASFSSMLTRTPTDLYSLGILFKYFDRYTHCLRFVKHHIEVCWPGPRQARILKAPASDMLARTATNLSSKGVPLDYVGRGVDYSN